MTLLQRPPTDTLELTGRLAAYRQCAGWLRLAVALAGYLTDRPRPARPLPRGAGPYGPTTAIGTRGVELNHRQNFIQSSISYHFCSGRQERITIHHSGITGK